MNPHQSLLNLTKSYLQESVTPHATMIDSDAEALQNALIGLGKLGLLALRVPSSWGGWAVCEETFQSFQELVARHSGALAFLQTQHQSAAAMLAQSHNELLGLEYLPQISKGNVLLGIGFSHLRRGGEPLVKAVPVTGGYQIEGFVPWVTGFGLFQQFIVAASLPDGQTVFGLMPFVQTSDAVGAITFSQPIKLAAMSSTNTVTATIKNWLLPEKSVVSVKSSQWIHENDKKNVLNATGLTLGCAMAGLDIVQAAYSNKKFSFIVQAFETLNQELSNCRSAIRQAQSSQTSLDKRLQLRAWAIDLAVRCAHAGVTVSGGAANYSNHAAQRVYREALVFSVSGQTAAVMEASLARLMRSPV